MSKKGGAVIHQVMPRLTQSVVANVRRNFSTPHLSAAEHFSMQLRDHEVKHAGEGWGQHFDFCMWNGSAAIMLSFAAIEAAIDEAEESLKVSRAQAGKMAQATLKHVQALLSHQGKPSFDENATLFKNAELLRKLRNGLVHPRAEWDNARVRNEKLSKAIMDAGLGLSPFQPDPQLAFPHGCMSAAVATWAASSARSFIRELRSRLDLPPTV